MSEHPPLVTALVPIVGDDQELMHPTAYSLRPVKNAILVFEKKSHKEYNSRK
jgi:hypothetical protein